MVYSHLMKKIIFYFLISFSLISLSSLSLRAEEKQYGDEEYNTLPTNKPVIPVGERNRYRNTYKTWNVWTSPFGYFFGNFSLGASYAFHQNVKVNIEPQFIYFFLAKPHVVGGGATLSTSIYFKKVYDGFYLEPGARILYLSQKRSLGGPTADGLVGGPQLIAGWGWIWDSGLNFNIGFGLGYYWGKAGKDVEDTDSFSGIFPASNLAFGFSF